jgi:hypothetical protein
VEDGSAELAAVVGDLFVVIGRLGRDTAAFNSSGTLDDSIDSLSSIHGRFLDTDSFRA